MTWLYTIETGILTDGHKTIHAYSGLPGKWKNNPDYISERGCGAIPIGDYTIGPMFDSSSSGRGTMHLTPQIGTNTYDRSGFEIHGDSISHPGAASHGCICTVTPSAYDDRKYIDQSADKHLRVVANASGAIA